MNNKRLAGFTTIILLMVITACSQAQQVTASKKYITRSFNTASFDGIDLTGSSDIIYKQTEGERSVQIYGSDNIVALMEVSVEKGILIVKFKKNTRIRNMGKLEIRVSAPSLSKATIHGSGDLNFANGLKSGGDLDVAIYGSGDIQGKGIRCNQLSTTISGSGSVTLNEIVATQASARISGSGDVNLSGTSTNVDYKISGSGSIEATNLKATNVTAQISGSGNISCYATENLKGSANGSGEVTYKGDPRIDFSRNGRRNLNKL